MSIGGEHPRVGGSILWPGVWVHVAHGSSDPGIPTSDLLSEAPNHPKILNP